MNTDALCNMQGTWVHHKKWPSWVGLQNTLIAPLQKVMTSAPKGCPVYDTKQYDGEVSVTLEI